MSTAPIPLPHLVRGTRTARERAAKEASTTNIIESGDTGSTQTTTTTHSSATTHDSAATTTIDNSATTTTTVRLQITIDTRLSKILRIHAAATEKSQGEIVAAALTEYLERHAEERIA